MSVVGMLSSRCRLPRPGTFRRNLTSLESTLQCIFPPVPRVDPSIFQSTVLLRVDTSRSLSWTPGLQTLIHLILYVYHFSVLCSERCSSKREVWVPAFSSLAYVYTSAPLRNHSISSPSLLLPSCVQSFILTLISPRTLFQKAPQPYLQIPVELTLLILKPLLIYCSPESVSLVTSPFYSHITIFPLPLCLSKTYPLCWPLDEGIPSLF